MGAGGMIQQRKLFFIEELKRHYRELISGAHRAETDAAVASDEIRDQERHQEDAKVGIEFGRMAIEHRKRRERARRELEQLIAFEKQGVPAPSADGRVALGALVDVSIEGDDGCEERTLFLLPVGAGTELHGPGGDGYVSVVTPSSPVGRSLRTARSGDSFEVKIRGNDREWTVVDVC